MNNSNQLAEFQTDFIASVFEKNTDISDFMRKHLTANGELSEAEQVNIYTNSIHSCLINALAQIYPVCEKLTGERFFYGMARNFILQRPSCSPDIAEYGNDFHIFISTFKAAECVPYLADIAELEWAYHRAFHTANESIFDFDNFSQYSAEELLKCEFSLPTNHKLIKSAFPVDEIWKVHQTEDLDRIKYGAGLDIKPRYFYIYRKELDINIEQLSQNEWEFLQAIYRYNDFNEVCENISDTFNIPELLTKSLRLGWINKVHIK